MENSNHLGLSTVEFGERVLEEEESMAVEGKGNEMEYESDPEDALRPSAMRRREASDDEDGDESDEEGLPARKRNSRASEGESEGLDEDEGKFDVEEEAEEDLEEEAELEEQDSEGGGDIVAPEDAEKVVESGADGGRTSGEPVGFQDENQLEEEEDEEKKEKEPYAVPTAGAFYMHDDRFRDNGRGRGQRRRPPEARKLWESKDDRAWVHDRFEEINLRDARYDEERGKPKGHFRGRGNSRARGTVHGFVRGNRSRAFDDNRQNNRSQGYDDSNNQNSAPRSVRGRGPCRYDRLTTLNKQYTKSHESTSNTSARRQSSLSSDLQPDHVLPRKHVFASSLNSASPPFYPSGSSNKNISVIHKRDNQTGIMCKTISSTMRMVDRFSTSHSGSMLRGKAIVDSVRHDKGIIDEYIPPVAGKSLTSSQLHSSRSLSLTNLSQSNSRFQGRGINISGPISHQPSTLDNEITCASAQMQSHHVQQKRVQTPVQTVLQISTQPMDQRPGSGTQSSSPRQAPSINSSDIGEARSPPGASKSNTLLAGKGMITNLGGSGRGSFVYSGAVQVLGANGAMSLAHGDQSFPATPALLQVMQFGGRHHGGLGGPAVGMALPGYVAQPQPGFGNSEMTWVPLLAGAAGALGASYCSPYIALDSSFYTCTPGHTSSSASSKEAGTTQPAHTWKSPQVPQTVNDEFGQHQNKPRRYSEMNFGQ